MRRPAKVAQILALAHLLQSNINRGLVTKRATVARKLGIMRARITQLLDLILTAPDLQLRVLEFHAVDGVEPLAELSSEGLPAILLRATPSFSAFLRQSGHKRPSCQLSKAFGAA